jgi:hypothetical protein
LGQNLEASGVARPAETAPHHIVAGAAEAAAPARGVLTQYGIDVNVAENRVFLPPDFGSANPLGAAVHSTLHTVRTGGYYESVNELLLGANSAGDVMDSLATFVPVFSVEVCSGCAEGLPTGRGRGLRMGPTGR